MSLAPTMPGSGSGRSDPAMRAAAVASVASADAAGRQTAFPACDLCATGAGTAGNALTLTLPAVAGKRHYLALVRIEKYTVAALALALTAPMLVATVNLTATPALAFSAAVLALGTLEVAELAPRVTPIVSAAANTDTTFTCPAQAGVIWRASAWYFTAP